MIRLYYNFKFLEDDIEFLGGKAGCPDIGYGEVGSGVGVVGDREEGCPESQLDALERREKWSGRSTFGFPGIPLDIPFQTVA